MSTSNTLTSSSGPSVYRSTTTSNYSNSRTSSSTNGSRKSNSRPSSSASERSKSSSSSLPTRRPKTSASVCAGGRDNHSFIVAVIEGRGNIVTLGQLYNYIYLYINSDLL
jgi:hypothetical protein